MILEARRTILIGVKTPQGKDRLPFPSVFSGVNSLSVLGSVCDVCEKDPQLVIPPTRMWKKTRGVRI